MECRFPAVSYTHLDVYKRQEVLEGALKRHVLIVLQRMKINIAQITRKTRSFRVTTAQIEDAQKALIEFGASKITTEAEALILDMDDNITPVQLVEYLHKWDIMVDRIDLIAESDKELRSTILEIHENLDLQQ